MNEIAAAIGVVQMNKIEGFQKRRNANDAALRKALAGSAAFDLLADGKGSVVHGHYCLTVVLKGGLIGHRPEIMERLKAAGVGVSVYYPVPLPLSRYYAEKYNWRESDFPNACRISHQSIALPVGPHLDVEDMEIIARGLTAAVEECMSNV